MVTLRPVRPEDKNTLRDWRNLPEVRQYMMNPHEIPPKDHERWFEAMLANPAAHYRIIVRDGRDVGLIHLTALQENENICEWGFYIAEESERGKGSASAAWYLALEEAFGTLWFSEVHAEVLERNAASLHLHRAFGFTEIATLRQHNLPEGGTQLVIGFTLTQENWRETRDAIAQRLQERGLLPPNV